MIQTFAKLCAPMFGGKATIKFMPGFHKMRPALRKTMLEQHMKLLRAEYEKADHQHKLQLASEDARNAAAIREARA